MKIELTDYKIFVSLGRKNKDYFKIFEILNEKNEFHEGIALIGFNNTLPIFNKFEIENLDDSKPESIVSPETEKFLKQSQTTSIMGSENKRIYEECLARTFTFDREKYCINKFEEDFKRTDCKV